MNLIHKINVGILLLLLCGGHLFSQNITIINGTVTDRETKEPLAGVNIILDGNDGTVTNEKGFYQIKTNLSKLSLSFRFIGYRTETKLLENLQGNSIVLNIEMLVESKLLDEVVVSAGRFEQKFSDVTVSMEVVKPAMLDNNLSISLESLIQKIPGVSMIGNQANIRGGSGYSYGAGSRVALLVNDLPMLSGVSGEAKWDFMPVENIEQIEVIKGASSVLFGSSALNGIINVRTGFPKGKPITKITISNGFYGDPAREEIKWWGNQRPFFQTIKASHSRKAGALDMVVSAYEMTDDGYRENDDYQRYRIGIDLKYSDKKIKGLCYGLSSGAMYQKIGMFLLWKDGDSGVYRIQPSFLQRNEQSRFNLDPFVELLKPEKYKQSLRTRLYRLEGKNNTSQSNLDYTYFGEYQYQRFLKNKGTWTSGIIVSYATTESELYGNTRHYGMNSGIYSQFDKKINRFSFSAGARWEAFWMDNDFEHSRPVFRSGINYALKEASFLRASLGQGYRYPSIAEKYTFTQVGALKIFSNDSLMPERGWSAELGYIQGFKIKSWKGYADIALFWTEYQEMIEFFFGQHYPDSIKVPTLWDFQNYTGFKAFNVTNARINGVELVTKAEGKIGKINAIASAGYTYTNPIDLNIPKNDTSQSRMLKYRYYHSFKTDFEINSKKFSTGVNIDYHSFMHNIDKAFEDSIRLPNGFPVGIILPGLKSYREQHNQGDYVIDFRLAWKINTKNQVMFIVKNLLNREYMVRPADIQPPRNFAFQYLLKI